MYLWQQKSLSGNTNRLLGHQPRLYSFNTQTTNPHLLYGEFESGKYDEDYVQAIVAAGGDWWGALINDVSPADVSRAQLMGIKVNLWNVESTPTGIDYTLTLNADALTLSDPDLLQRRYMLADTLLACTGYFIFTGGDDLKAPEPQYKIASLMGIDVHQ